MDVNASFSSTNAGWPGEGGSTVTQASFDSQSIAKTYGWVVFQLVFYVLVIVLGILGNGLIVRVYSVKVQRVKTTTAVLVMALAFSDLAVCVFRFRNVCILQAHLTERPVSATILYLEIPDKFVIATTVALTGLIAFDRYDSVCRPNRRLLGHKSALVAAMGCFLFSMLANAPLVVHILNPFFQPLLISFLTPVFQVLAFSVSFIMIVVCYSKVYYRIRRHVKVGVCSLEVRPRVFLNVDMNTETPKIAPKPASPLTHTRPTARDTLQCSPRATAVSCPSASTSSELRFLTSLTIPKAFIGHETPTADTTRTTSSTNFAWADRSTESQPQQRVPSHPINRPDGRRKRRSFQRKTTRMLFITSVVFILTWLPQGVYVGTQLSGKTSVTSPVSPDTLFNLKPLLFLNNMINPVIYGLANRRFREGCIDVLTKLKIRFRRTNTTPSTP